jgi:hypothetical protein
MDVRYQIFVSSTYEDLQEERAEVMQALLELDCMPAGMELFPAASQEQWRWITRVIDESDYYIVLIAGKYGSINPSTGLSYTEMEYQYALDAGKPCIGFIIDKSVDLPVSKAETDADKREKLAAFKAVVQTKLCKFWDTSSDLGAKVSRSITQLIKREPATGWIKADLAARTNNEAVLTLKNRVLELERELDSFRRNSRSLEYLAQGSDPFVLTYNLHEHTETKTDNHIVVSNPIILAIPVATTWDEIASAIGSVILRDGVVRDIEAAFLRFYSRHIGPAITSLAPNKAKARRQVKLDKSSIDQVRLQYVALGYITVDPSKGRLRPDAEKWEQWVPTSEGIVYFGRRTAILRDFRRERQKTKSKAKASRPNNKTAIAAMAKS